MSTPCLYGGCTVDVCSCCLYVSLHASMVVPQLKFFDCTCWSKETYMKGKTSSKYSTCDNIKSLEHNNMLPARIYTDTDLEFPRNMSLFACMWKYEGVLYTHLSIPSPPPLNMSPYWSLSNFYDKCVQLQN